MMAEIDNAAGAFKDLREATGLDKFMHRSGGDEQRCQHRCVDRSR